MWTIQKNKLRRYSRSGKTEWNFKYTLWMDESNKYLIFGQIFHYYFLMKFLFAKPCPSDADFSFYQRTWWNYKSTKRWDQEYTFDTTWSKNIFLRLTYLKKFSLSLSLSPLTIIIKVSHCRNAIRVLLYHWIFNLF